MLLGSLRNEITLKIRDFLILYLFIYIFIYFLEGGGCPSRPEQRSFELFMCFDKITETQTSSSSQKHSSSSSCFVFVF